MPVWKDRNRLYAQDRDIPDPTEYKRLKHLNREMVEILINYISVGKRIPKTQDVPIEIH